MTASRGLVRGTACINTRTCLGAYLTIFNCIASPALMDPTISGVPPSSLVSTFLK